MKRQSLTRVASAAIVAGLMLSPLTPSMTAIAEQSNPNGQALQQPSEKPDGENGNENGQPPEKPEGEDGNENGQTPPEKPEGNVPDGKPDGNPGQPGGADTMSYDYTGEYGAEVTADATDVTDDDDHSTSESLRNVLLAKNGGTLKASGSTISKTGDATDADACNFYGVNSILLSVGEGSLLNSDSQTLTSDADGANGIFAIDDGTVYAGSTSISTTKDNSRGLDATYGGTIIASGLDIDTEGDHSAGIATDRGGGDISVAMSNVDTKGSGSPVIYSTGNIQVNGLVGQADGSQIAGMEGLNTILIDNSTLTSTITDKTASDPVPNGVIIYQSTSGDAESTTGERATFQVHNSTLNTSIEDGTMFYVTNTDADILLDNAFLEFDSGTNSLIQVVGNDSNDWGKAGENGGNVNLTVRSQSLYGNAIVDGISTMSMYLTDSSTWTGRFNGSSDLNSDDQQGDVSMYISSGSTWEVAGDTTVTNLKIEDGGKVKGADGEDVLIVDSDGNVLSDGSDTVARITVTGEYGEWDGTGATEPSTDMIDRSGFDEAYGTDTSWTFGEEIVQKGSSDGTTANKSVLQAIIESIASFFSGIGETISRLF